MEWFYIIIWYFIILIISNFISNIPQTTARTPEQHKQIRQIPLANPRITYTNTWMGTNSRRRRSTCSLCAFATTNLHIYYIPIYNVNNVWTRNKLRPWSSTSYHQCSPVCVCVLNTRIIILTATCSTLSFALYNVGSRCRLPNIFCR